MADATSLRPIQVLLDTKRFIDVPEPQDFGGGKKDFYANDDLAFVQHKEKIRERLQGISSSLQGRREDLGFLKVQMRDDALAKSYRPLGSLFTESHGFALVGAHNIGELIIQATPSAINQLDKIIEEKAEKTPKLKPNSKTGVLERRPTGYRSEVGAIDEIKLHGNVDRLAFSAEQAVAWLSQPNVLGGYLIELFRPDPARGHEAVTKAIMKLQSALASLGGITVRPFLPTQQTSQYGLPPLLITVQLTTHGKSHIDLPFHPDGQPQISVLKTGHRELAERDLSASRHQQFLALLAEQSLVREIELPPLIESTPAATSPIGPSLSIPAPQADTDYPVVGIIDGGIATTTPLSPWCVGDAGLVPKSDRDERHGTFIAGLVVAGATLNPHIAQSIEATGCKFYDLDLLPRKELRSTYYNDIDYFFDLLEEKIKTAKEQFSVRIFNFSLAILYPRDRFGYSPIADRFDRIARANDVILVVSAGNLPPAKSRPPWPLDPASAVHMLASFGGREEQLAPPAEHFLGLTVGAINPPGVVGHEVDMPTTYTCRGPGVGGARKPDLAHYGGAEPSLMTTNRTGLCSLTPLGATVENCGTSFAAPSTAAIVATLDQRLDRRAPREVLLGLSIHRSKRPAPLQHKNLNHISREFVGFGLCPPADAMLMDDTHAITLVFSEVLRARQNLIFPFTWPSPLVNQLGKCRGRIDLTLAYTPPIDPDHKEEAQRIQLEAAIWQEQIEEESGEVHFESRLNHDGAKVPQGMHKSEKYLLMTGLKWSPIKRYFASMPKGRGNSSNWRLGLESLTRAGAAFPRDGVPFTILLTISDPTKQHHIHDELRRQLEIDGVSIADIMIAHRVRARSS
jgi:hypothetical protein